MLRHAVCALVASLALAFGGQHAAAETPLLVYDFHLGPDAAANVDYVKSLGFQGIVTRLKDPIDLEKLTDYARRVGPMDDFRLMPYVSYDFNNPAAPAVWRRALPVLAAMDAPLWVVIKKAPSDDALIDLVRTMATTAAARGIATVLYPHAQTSINTADEAAAVIDAIAHPQVFNSLHTCHEILGGNQYTVDDVVASHAHETAMVAIAGAKENASTTSTGIGGFGVDWNQVIKPLDNGQYSLLPFLQALEDAGYDGPVILQTFGIQNDPGHLEDSIVAYDEYLDEVVPSDG